MYRMHADVSKQHLHDSITCTAAVTFVLGGMVVHRFAQRMADARPFYASFLMLYAVSSLLWARVATLARRTAAYRGTLNEAGVKVFDQPGRIAAVTLVAPALMYCALRMMK